jgi:hypothetical protein
MSHTQFFIGLDLGQSKDFTALAIIEKIAVGEEWRFECRHLERVPLGTLYPAIVEKVKALMNTPQLKDNSRLVVDATGVGRPVVDMLRAAELNPKAILITGGDVVSYDSGYTRVPKRDLVAILHSTMQTQATPENKRLDFAQGLPDIQTLVSEMMAFQVKITTSANDTYGSWREGSHDDLVLAVALAVWEADQPIIVLEAPPRSRIRR